MTTKIKDSVPLAGNSSLSETTKKYKQHACCTSVSSSLQPAYQQGKRGNSKTLSIVISFTVFDPIFNFQILFFLFIKPPCKQAMQEYK